MQSKQALVPKLRFGEFEGEWKDTQMESVFPQIRNGFVGTATPFYKRGGVRYIQGRNIKKGKILNNGFEEVTQEFHNKQHKSQVREADILMVQSGHVGECAVVTKEFVDSNCHAVLVLSPIKQDINSSFCVNYFYAERGLRIIYKIRTGNTIAHILSSDLKKSHISLPSLPEQEKIAAFLTSVDDRIDQLKRKKSLLQDYKKGAMQKLFSQELRFKDEQGKDYPDWEEKKLGEICEFSRGKNIPAAKNAKYTLLGMGSVGVEGRLISSKTTAENKGALKKNDLIMPERDIGVGLIIGRVALVKEDNQYILGSNLLSLRPNKDFNSAFLHQYINSEAVRPKLRRLVNGSAQLMITSKEVKGVKSLFPVLPEQAKIANFLSSLDQKIEQIDTQITQTQTFKKGLLQQMFV